MVEVVTRQAVTSPQSPSQTPAAKTSREVLFDSIAREGIGAESRQQSSMKTAFTALLWMGYLIAVVVAMALVWSAAKELL